MAESNNDREKRVVQLTDGEDSESFTEKEIIRIAQRIADKWELIALSTGKFKKWEIDTIRRNFQDNVEKANQMLHDYKSKLGCRKDLVSALIDHGKHDVAKEVESKLLQATMSEAPQEADPVSGVRPGVEQATNPASLVRPGQALRENVSTENEEAAEKPFDVQPEDEQARNPPSGVPPGDKQATNPVSRVHLGGPQEARETFPTGDEQAAGEHVATDIQPEDEQARNPTIYTYVLKVKGVVTEVAIGYNFATDPVTALGELFSIPGWANVVISVVVGVFLRLGEIRNVMAGCIQFELRCFNEDGFLEVLRDYESGKLEKRLQKKFLKIGIKTTGLEVKITNSEDVERTKADIEKRRSYSTPAKTESKVQKRRNEALSVTDEGEVSTEKEPDTKDPEKIGVEEIGTKIKESLIVTETDDPERFTQPEITQIGKSIPDIWGLVARSTGKFEDAEINAIKFDNGAYPTLVEKAVRMLNLYVNRNGSRKTLVAALKSHKMDDLANLVESKRLQGESYGH